MVAKVVKVTESGKHTGDASCLAASEEHVFSGGADGLIKVSLKIAMCAKRLPSRSVIEKMKKMI